jgi:hypothetical protein
MKGLVGLPGFEPGTSCTPSKRASQAAPQPEESMTYNQSVEICTLASYIESFIQERKFLRGVTDSTLAWYRHSFKAFGKVLEQPYPSVAAFKQAVMLRIAELQTSGRGNKNVFMSAY